MRICVTLLALVVTACLPPCIQAKQVRTIDIPEYVRDEGSYGNPGLTAKLTSVGLAYMREIGIRMINRIVRQLDLPNSVSTPSPIGRGTITIKGIKVIDYWAPESYDLELLPANSFRWVMKGMGVRTAGKFAVEISLDNKGPPIAAQGDWDALVDYMDYEITVKLGKTVSGYPTITASGCKVVVHGLDIQFGNAGFLQSVLPFLGGTISQQVKPMLSNQICSQTKNLINKEANKLLKNLPLMIPLQPKKNDREKRQIDFDPSMFKGIIGNILNENMILDLTLMDAPRTYSRGYAKANLKGEISWKGAGGTPFYPARMLNSAPPGQEMLQLYISDYVINSLIYTVHKRDLLDITIKADDSPQMKGVLVTSCDFVCLGFLLPLEYEYPDHYIDIKIETNKMPSARFSEGFSQVYLNANVTFSVREKGSQKSIEAVKSVLDMSAGLFLDFDPSGQKLVGQVRLREMTLELIESVTTDVDQDSLDQVVVVMEELLVNAVNGMLKAGIDLPKTDGITLVQPKITFKDHHLVLNTYFKVDQSFINNMVDKI